jgi:hypothetical protein
MPVRPSRACVGGLDSVRGARGADEVGAQQGQSAGVIRGSQRPERSRGRSGCSRWWWPARAASCHAAVASRRAAATWARWALACGITVGSWAGR